MRCVALSLLCIVAVAQTATAADHPNIIVILVDDLGYGDLSCSGATAVNTPNIDRIAAEGCRFTDGHSSAATCTPSRYALLTGEYAWRRKDTGIAPGDAGAIILPGRTTVASLLKSAGYRSTVVGKWHLGLGRDKPDWNGRITPGPIDIGFDECFLMPATGDRVPCVYVENDHVVGLDPADPISVSFSGPFGDEPTGLKNPELLKMAWDHGHNATIINGISRIGFMTGGRSARWIDEDMADVFTAKAVHFIDRHVANHQDQPFFLFFNPHDIHVPRAPHQRFAGSTQLGPRGDAIRQLDWSVGEILHCLDQHQITNNTLLIFTSDNGPVLNDGYRDQAAELNGNHRPAGPWRGGKYSAFEGGTRVPFLARWPGHIQAGTTSDALVCQIDFLATFAELTGENLPPDAGPDSQKQLRALTGADRHGRDHLVEQAATLSLRQGHWKFIEPSRGQALNRQVNIETGNNPEPQLYDLQSDPGETRNLAAAESRRLAEMQQLLNQIRKPR
ncbi:MAG: Arylsulfatase [Planctomycetota bacterium]|jgi:arylsulfatase A-like enzyme